MATGSSPPSSTPPVAKRAAVDDLMSQVYDELRHLAGKYLSEGGAGVTLQPTLLVHEAYLRMLGQRQAEWQNRAQFFLVAAQMMRRVLVDHCRSRQAKKRGGEQYRVSLTDVPALAEGRGDEIGILALDSALSALAQLDPRQASIVELRFFAGLSVEETAEALGVSTATVKREWAAARAWLLVEIEGHRPPHGT